MGQAETMFYNMNRAVTVYMQFVSDAGESLLTVHLHTMHAAAGWNVHSTSSEILSPKPVHAA